MKKVIHKIKLMIDRLIMWGGAYIVKWDQKENTIVLTVQRIGLFKNNVGLPMLCEIKIDPTLVKQVNSENNDS